MRKVFFLFFFLFSITAPAFPGGDDFSKPLKDGVFSVSTDDMNSSDSLNRVAGTYDKGFSSPEQSYKSKEHAGAGPFAHEKAEMASRDSSQSSY